MSSSCDSRRLDPRVPTRRNQMAQLVAEQVLKMMDISIEAECPKRTLAFDQQVPNTSVDQQADQVIVQGPPRVVVAGHRDLHQTDHLIDHRREDRERTPITVTRDQERCLGPPEYLAPYGLQPCNVRGARRPAPMRYDLFNRTNSGASMTCLLAPDPGGGGPA